MMTYSKKRIEALQERLEQEGLDGLLLATGASFAYLLDMASLPFQRTSETKNQRGAPSIEALNVPDCCTSRGKERGGSSAFLGGSATCNAPLSQWRSPIWTFSLSGCAGTSGVKGLLSATAAVLGCPSS